MAGAVDIPAQYRSLFEGAAATYGIPVDLLAMIARHESSFDPAAVGDNGDSYGLFQLNMPSHPGISQAQALDPVWATHYAARALGERYRRYGENLAATIISWNTPVGGDIYARTGTFATGGLGRASQAYLSATLAPFGGIKGVLAAHAATQNPQVRADLAPPAAPTVHDMATQAVTDGNSVLAGQILARLAPDSGGITAAGATQQGSGIPGVVDAQAQQATVTPAPSPAALAATPAPTTTGGPGAGTG